MSQRYSTFFSFSLFLLLKGLVAYDGSVSGHFDSYHNIGQNGFRHKSVVGVNNAMSGNSFKAFRNKDTSAGDALEPSDKDSAIKRIYTEYSDYPLSDYVSGMQNKLEPEMDDFQTSQDVMLQASVRLPIGPRRRRAFKTNVINRIAHGFGKRNNLGRSDIDINEVDDVISRSDLAERNSRMYQSIMSRIKYDILQDSLRRDITDADPGFLDLLKTYLQSTYAGPIESELLGDDGRPRS